MKFKSFFSVLTILLVSILLTNKVSASENSLNLKIDASTNQINLEWNNIGSSYELVKDGEIVWSGQDSQVLLTDLESNTKYNYNLVVYNAEKTVVNQTNIRATTTGDSSIKKRTLSAEKSNPMDNIFVSSSFDQDNVRIFWEGNVPDDDGIYEVYRDGKFIGTTADNNFYDDKIDINKDYNYEIIGKAKMSEEEIKELKAAIESRNENFVFSNEDLVNTYTINRLVKTYNTNTVNKSTVMKAAVSSTEKYTMRYTTFIPTEYADNPFSGGGVTGLSYFGGDNRSYSLTSNRFRTRSDVNITFSGTSSSVSLTKTVNPTIFYNYNYKPIDAKVASSSGMTISNISKSSSKVSYKIKHDIGIPYLDAISPDITYTYTATVYKDGGYSITGEHDKAPSHEMYIFIPNTDLSNAIHKFKNQGFQYLMPLYSNEKFTASY